MQEELITFETAKLAKEKGFNIKVWDYFQITTAKNPSELCTLSKTNWNNYEPTLSRPTQSLLAKWLREVHNIEVFFRPFINTNTHIKHYKSYVLWYDSIIHHHQSTNGQESMEQALEVGLQEGLKLIK